MSFSHASVTATARLNAHLQRITLRIDDPDALAVPPEADAAVGVYFALARPDRDLAPPPQGRTYSVRHHDGDLIDLDIVLHGDGPGTAWARHTQPGDLVGLDHATSWYRPGPNTDWQLLVCDLSGLPALARIVEELGSGTDVTAIVEVADAADLDYLPTHPALTVIPSVCTGNGAAPSKLAQLVGTHTMPDGQGYCWFAGEAAESRAVRKHFRGQGWPLGQTDITGYWRFGAHAWEDRYALVADEMFAVYQRARAAGKSDKAAAEEYDEALERAGL